MRILSVSLSAPKQDAASVRILNINDFVRQLLRNHPL